MRVPPHPRGVSIDANLQLAQRQQQVLKPGSAFLYSWFYNQVRNRGPWDYKQQSRDYEAFGNFNYGATGTAAGFSETVLLRAAGFAQSRAGTSNPELGKWWGEAPYGDDFQDQEWISKGVAYAKWKHY
ncbi:polymorphic toxin type 44 domain-containing protein [Pseudomonas sp.]|uniref:polymorphic toxin type 44 domain-containing protein n=1 Tax=Pseudomonas sp. TaxID=306 RepID=UPI00258FEAE4|nr:polymorphic toxin type 44 domain-containing protein [Pseudomonas sp.]